MGLRVSVTLILMIFFAPICYTRTARAEDEIQEALTRRLYRHPVEPSYGQVWERSVAGTENSCLTTIYEKAGGRPLWVNSSGPGAKATVIEHFLRSSSREGIDPGNYASERISSLFSATDPDDLAHLDVLITYNLARYIYDMRFGQLELNRLEPDCSVETDNGPFRADEAIKVALGVPDLGAYLESLVPDHAYYTKLRTALRVYRDMANNHSWLPIPPGPLIRPEDQDRRLAEIRRRLVFINGERSIAGLPIRYTGKFVETVKHFQHYHGLREDGIIGPRTLYWLNKTPQDLVNLICVNMARWRRQIHDLDDTHIMVNIAGFSLKAVRNSQTELEMPVIVGDVEHKTPMFSDTIKYLDFNPFWNLPPSIARDEELPALQKNPRHLADRHIRVFSSWRSDGVELDPLVIDWESVNRSQISRFKLRQDSGPWNALGRVKFVFPNHYSIYLHDTPLRKLFNYPARAFSHGCIRVSQALDLALFCLQNEKGDWTTDKIQRIIDGQDRRVVRLSSQVPVHITYQTVWFDKDGSIHFNDDIYSWDASLLEILKNN